MKLLARLFVDSILILFFLIMFVGEAKAECSTWQLQEVNRNKDFALFTRCNNLNQTEATVDQNLGTPSQVYSSANGTVKVWVNSKNYVVGSDGTQYNVVTVIFRNGISVDVQLACMPQLAPYSPDGIGQFRCK